MPEFSYACLEVNQRANEEAPLFCIFHAPVSQILQWASIRRLSEQRGMPQREKNDAKVRSIARFLRLNARNTIPTAITLSLNVPEGCLTRHSCTDDLQISRLRIEIPEELPDDQKPGSVIDGQHRLLGMDLFEEDPSIPVVALINADLLETAFQFIVINNKGSKVATDHIRALVNEPDLDALKARLQTARVSLDRNYSLVAQVNNDEASPFRNNIDWPSNRTGQHLVVPNAIEAALAEIQSRNVRYIQDSEDYLLEFFYSMWWAVKGQWGDLWAENSKLMSKAGLVAMNQYMSDALINLSDWGRLDLRDVEDVKDASIELLDNQAKEFWTVSWTAASLDTKSGRQLIVNSLTQISRNLRARLAWYTDVDLVDTGELGR